MCVYTITYIYRDNSQPRISIEIPSNVTNRLQLKNSRNLTILLIIPAFCEEKKGIMCDRSPSVHPSVCPSVRPEAVYHQPLLHY